ncbi:MAG: hypothetical protein Q621_VSBC00323G0001, partial [Veillonella sp. DORA_B_18_19_23]
PDVTYVFFKPVTSAVKPFVPVMLILPLPFASYVAAPRCKYLSYFAAIREMSPILAPLESISPPDFTLVI